MLHFETMTPKIMAKATDPKQPIDIAVLGFSNANSRLLASERRKCFGWPRTSALIVLINLYYIDSICNIIRALQMMMLEPKGSGERTSERWSWLIIAKHKETKTHSKLKWFGGKMFHIIFTLVRWNQCYYIAMNKYYIWCCVGGAASAALKFNRKLWLTF